MTNLLICFSFIFSFEVDELFPFVILVANGVVAFHWLAFAYELITPKGLIIHFNDSYILILLDIMKSH